MVTGPVLLICTRVEALAGGGGLPRHVGVWDGKQAGRVQDALGKGGLGGGGAWGQLSVAEKSFHRLEVGAVLLMLLVVLLMVGMVGRWGKHGVNE